MTSARWQVLVFLWIHRFNNSISNKISLWAVHNSVKKLQYLEQHKAEISFIKRGYTEQIFFTCITAKHKERLWVLFFFGGGRKSKEVTSTSLVFQWTAKRDQLQSHFKWITERTGIIRLSVVAKGMDSISAAGMALQGWKRHITDAFKGRGKCSMSPKLAAFQCTTQGAGFYLHFIQRTDMIDIDP